jgi:carbon-monoxide dehydrogenase large subunit
MTLRTAFEKNVKLLASQDEYNINNGAYPHGADCNIAVSMFLWAAYKMPRFGFYTKGWYTNTAGLAAYRGPWALESLARETVLDIAARRLGIDPIEIRRRNLVTKADQPCATPFGIQLEDITPAECLEKLLETLDVAAFRTEQAAARREGRYLGLGFAAYIEPTAGSAGISVLASDVAQVRIEPTGKVTAVLSTHSQGHGTQTTMAQVIAERLGVPFEDVSIFEDDSSRGGFGAGASGSRQAVSGGGASIKAADLLADKVKRIAAHLFQRHSGPGANREWSHRNRRPREKHAQPARSGGDCLWRARPPAARYGIGSRGAVSLSSASDHADQCGACLHRRGGYGDRVREDPALDL